MKKELTAAERYLASRKDAPRKLVDVIVPSGAVFVFEQPSKFSLLFNIGKLPQLGASEAVEEWTEAGLVEAAERGDPNVLQFAGEAFSIADRVLALSYSPKLVRGQADPAKDELSTDDIDNDDLAYLFKWAAAGGEVSLMLKTFPEGSQPNAVARPNRKARRAKAKSVGRS